MGDWSNFFAAEVAASAALTGLIVVAISINLSQILAYAHLPGRAAEALFTLGGVLVLTSVALVPHQPVPLFGFEALGIGIMMFSMPLIVQLQTLKAGRDIPLVRKYMRAGLTAVPSLSIILAGALLAIGWSGGLYWIAAGVILSLVAGVTNAWILLVEIMR